MDFNGYDAAGRNKRIMKFTHNQVREPMMLSRDLHTPLVRVFVPDPLHVVKLGVQNDIITNLQEAFPRIVGDWLEGLKQMRDRGGMAGNLLNGKQMDIVCKDENLYKLQVELEKIGEGHLGACSVAYIQACKALYLCCVRKQRHPDYKTIIRNYTHHFKIMKDLGYVSETVKGSYKKWPIFSTVYLNLWVNSQFISCLCKLLLSNLFSSVGLLKSGSLD